MLPFILCSLLLFGLLLCFPLGKLGAVKTLFIHTKLKSSWDMRFTLYPHQIKKPSLQSG